MINTTKMRLLQRLTYFLYGSNFIVAFAGASLVAGVCALFHLKNGFDYAILIFCLLFSVYTLQRFVDHEGFTEEDTDVWGRYSIFSIVFSAIFICVAFVKGLTLLSFSVEMLFLIGLFTLISIWYTIPIFGLKLRTIPGLKLLFIASTWIFACVYFPLKNEMGVDNFTVIKFCTSLLLYIVATILPFDIRDKGVDSMVQSTIPQLIGVHLTKLLGICLYLLFGYIAIYSEWISTNNYLFYGAIIYQVILMGFVTEKRPFYYFLLVDLGIAFLGWSFFY